MEIDWRPSEAATAMHAAALVAAGARLAREDMSALLSVPVEDLEAAAEVVGVGSERFWPLAAALAGWHPSNRELAERVLAKFGVTRPGSVVRIEACIDAVERAVSRAAPDLSEELRRRQGPLQEQWEARGPGLLARLADLAGPDLIAPRAVVFLVEPVQGGGGAADLLFNSVRFEAVLYHPLPELPETVRLGWLLGQLQCDIPRFGEQIPPSELPRVAGWALAPAALTAAAQTELVRDAAGSLPAALAAWRLCSADDSEAAAARLWAWWERRQARAEPWSDSLRQLQQLLPERSAC